MGSAAQNVELGFLSSSFATCQLCDIEKVTELSVP